MSPPDPAGASAARRTVDGRKAERRLARPADSAGSSRVPAVQRHAEGRAAGSADPGQLSFLPPDGAALLHLMRENLRLMAQLAIRYEVAGLTAAEGQAVLRIRSPAGVANYLGPELAALAQEQLRVVLLDTRLQVLGTSLVYQGGHKSTTVRLADCFREAVRLGADSVIFAHNHPTGDPTPSPDDVRMTADAARAGELLGIEVLDHLVIGRGGTYVSLRTEGLYQPPSQSHRTSESPGHSGALRHLTPPRAYSPASASLEGAVSPRAGCPDSPADAPHPHADRR
jgi:hypothetical protein